MMRTANPALNDKTFEGLEHLLSRSGTDAKRMTIYGAAHKTAILLVLAIITAGITWKMFYQAGGGAAGFAAVKPWLITGGFGGFIVALITIFGNKKWAIVTAPCYALLEGLLLGALSAMFEVRFPGIVIQAVGLTFGVTFALLLAYITRVIKPTEKFKAGIYAAFGGIIFVYIASIVLRMFGTDIPYIHGSGPIGIGFSIVVVVIAALTLVLNFDFIEKAAEKGAPKYMEWYAAFGLMVTLVWLYLEILILLSKIQGRD